MLSLVFIAFLAFVIIVYHETDGRRFYVVKLFFMYNIYIYILYITIFFYLYEHRKPWWKDGGWPVSKILNPGYMDGCPMRIYFK